MEAQANHKNRSRKKAWPKQPTIAAFMRWMFLGRPRWEIHRHERILSYLAAEGVPCAQIAEEIEKQGGSAEIYRKAVAAYPRQRKKARAQAKTTVVDIDQADKFELRNASQ